VSYFWWFLSWLSIWSWWWRWYGSLKHLTVFEVNWKDITLFHSYCKENLIPNMVVVFTIFSLLLLMQDPMVYKVHCHFVGHCEEQSHLVNPMPLTSIYCWQKWWSYTSISPYLHGIMLN
jgi:hypothetical protein